MPKWDQILSEINQANNKQKSGFDNVRYKYIGKLAKYTNRNVICYYSGWLTKPGKQNADINDTDIQGFMSAMSGLDYNKGLDLILHTPGGSPTASESIVNYLRSKFSDIRAIVPQLAMSAGTMIACSSNQIVMGQHSSLGPVDPQINGVPAYNIIQEFVEAKKDLATSPENYSYWKMTLEKYPLTIVKIASDAIKLSDDLLSKWLSKYMFSTVEENERKTKVKAISAALNENDNSKTHGRHFNIDFCKEIGLNIYALEDDNVLQDCVLSLHHAYTFTLSSTPAIKIIENNSMKSYISHVL